MADKTALPAMEAERKRIINRLKRLDRKSVV